MADSETTIIQTYPQKLSPKEPAQTLYQVIRKLPDAFRTLGAVKSAQHLMPSVFDIVCTRSAQYELMVRETLIQQVPAMVDVLMKAPDANEKTKVLCIHYFIQPFSDMLVGNEASSVLKHAIVRAIIQFFPSLDDEIFQYYLLPVVRGLIQAKSDIDDVMVEMVRGFLPRLTREDLRWVGEGIDTLRKSTNSCIKRDSLKLLVDFSRKCTPEDNKLWCVPYAIDFSRDKTWIVRNELALSLPVLFSGIDDEDTCAMFAVFDRLLKDDIKQVRFSSVKVLDRLLPIAGFRVCLRESDVLTVLKDLIAKWSEGVHILAVTRALPALLDVFPEQEKTIVDILTFISSLHDEEETIPVTVASVIGPVAERLVDREVAFAIYDNLLNASPKVKEEARKDLPRFVRLDNLRFGTHIPLVIKEGGWRVRQEIAQHLCELREHPDYEKFLFELLVDPTWMVRQTALAEARMRLQLHPESHQDFFIQVLDLQLKNYNQRKMFIQLLVLIADVCPDFRPRVVPLVMHQLEDKCANVRVVAVEGLAALKIFNTDVTLALQNAQRDADCDVRRVATLLYNTIL